MLFLVLSPNPHMGFLAFSDHPDVNLSAPISPDRKVQPSGRASSDKSAPRTYIICGFGQRWQVSCQVASLDLPIVEVRAWSKE